MTDDAGMKTKRGWVRKHSLGEVLYYAFVVPQPDGSRRMERKARVLRVYKCAHIRDIRSRYADKSREGNPTFEGGRNNMVLRIAADAVNRGQGRFIRIHRYAREHSTIQILRNAACFYYAGSFKQFCQLPSGQ